MQQSCGRGSPGADFVTRYSGLVHALSSHELAACSLLCHSCPQRPRSFWSAPRIVTSGQVQRHSGFEWICKHHRLRPEPIRFVRLDSEHAQSDRKSVNRGLPLLDPASVQRSRFLVLTKRIVVSGDKNARMKKNHNRLRMSSILHPTDFAFFLLL